MNNEIQFDISSLKPPSRKPELHLEATPTSLSSRVEDTKTPKTTVLSVSNSEFIQAVFQNLPTETYAAICTKPNNPEVGGWVAKRADLAAGSLSPDNNNYLCGSSFRLDDDGSFNVKKENGVACHFLMLDDLGTKIPFDRLAGFKLSWLIETSPGNFQGGILLSEPLSPEMATQLHKAIINAGLCDPGASGPSNRWARLPNAINGKSKYADENGAPFPCRVVEWRPEKRYTFEGIVSGLKLELTPSDVKDIAVNPMTPAQCGNDVFTPKATENPVLTALKFRGLYKKPLGSGKHDITCPWANEHTDALDTGAAYFEPNAEFSIGGFCCQHSHREKYHIHELLESLGIHNTQARHKPVIRLVAGEIHTIIDAIEKELANSGYIYQSGGLLSVVKTDQENGNTAIITITKESLTQLLSSIFIWEKYDGRSKNWVRCDPPVRHITILHDAQHFKYVPALLGVARQPYFRETDGKLIKEAGYDPISKLFGVFDSSKYVQSEPTKEAALKALALLEELLKEFHFVAPFDKAAALSAIFTAVTRPTLDYAPAFHVKAPASGSGKSYLCDLIGAFATPGNSNKVSYPTNSDEATKTILSALLTGPALVEFDDMATDWMPHGIINRMLTSTTITDRILGVSKMATVSTRTLFLGSGNNVGPLRDLLRRVLTIHLDTRTATPATMIYEGSPVEKVRKGRECYISAVLTIILAWRNAGSPKTHVENIVTYSGAWSDYCRHPLMWLGQPDPATALLNQVKHDPDADALGGLMAEWLKAFGSKATTVRKVVVTADQNPDLYDALCEFPVEERGGINRSKLGRLLSRNANRIVGGLEFQKAQADGRNAWQLVKVNATAQSSLLDEKHVVTKKTEQQEHLDKLFPMI
jgi:hypothetical protein